MRTVPYSPTAAVAYARKWALARNPVYYDFSQLGGDCTNFISQCIYAGSGIMNETPDVGWYYHSLSDRAPAWSGVKFLSEFLLQNRGVGPFGHIVPLSEAVVGDVVQLGRGDGVFYHTMILTSVSPQLQICCHSFDALDRPLSAYRFHTARILHIDGVRRFR